MTNLTHLLASVIFLFTFITRTLSSNNVLYSSSGDVLKQGDSLRYKDYALTLQDDCNLVLSGPNHKILWQTYTSQILLLPCSLQLNSNGELVLFYVFRLFPFVLGQWSSGVTSKEGEYALVLGYDGSLKIYGPSLWTARNKVEESYQYLEPSEDSKIPVTDSTIWSGDIAPIPVTDSTLWSGDIAPIGTVIVKDQYKLELGWTCNMTLTDTKSGRVLWHTDTKDTTRDCFVNQDRDGQLTVKYLGGATLWANNAASDWGQEYVLALLPQGLLKVYGPVIWTATNSFSVKEPIIAMVTAQ